MYFKNVCKKGNFLCVHSSKSEYRWNCRDRNIHSNILKSSFLDLGELLLYTDAISKYYFLPDLLYPNASWCQFVYQLLRCLWGISCILGMHFVNFISFWTGCIQTHLDLICLPTFAMFVRHILHTWDSIFKFYIILGWLYPIVFWSLVYWSAYVLFVWHILHTWLLFQFSLCLYVGLLFNIF